MALSNFVAVTISTLLANPSRRGFGVPLVPSFTASWVERSRKYTSYAGVAADFGAGTPELLAAAAIFGQSPSPKEMYVGRCANKPTMTYQLSAVSVINSHTYRATVAGTGFATTEVFFTTDASATDGEWAAGMVAALNAVPSKNYTAAGAASPVTITGNTPAAWFSIQVMDLATQRVVMTHADAGIAADLTAITAEQPLWFALYPTFQSNALVTAAAAWIEANERVMFFDTNDSQCCTTAIGNSEILDDARLAAYKSTGGIYHDSPAAFAGAAALGRWLPKDPGQSILGLKILAGVPAVPLTATHRANLVARNAGSIETVAGINILFEGKASGGEWLDTRRDTLWLKDDMQIEVLTTLVNNEKIAYTDLGIATVRAAVERSLKRAVRQTVLASYQISVLPASEVSAGDKAARKVTAITWTGVLAGAIQSADIGGSITY